MLGAIASVALPILGKIFGFKEGGMVKGTKKGKAVMAVVHTGERVLTDKQNKQYEKMMKSKKMKVPANKGKVMKVKKMKK
jgi:hypothetical protein